MSEYTDAALAAVERVKAPDQRLSTQTLVAAAGIEAVTYALLDLAAAIREHGAR